MDRLFISFSGGRTSAYMTRRLLKQAPAGLDIVVGFANTGKEDERTLKFVNDCDQQLDFNTVWIEADVKEEKGIGTAHRIVNFYTASRAGEPFEAMIKKYGIPNKNFPHCTRELKLSPMTSYLRSIGWESGSYNTAIGIRADEVDRISATYRQNDIIYPLVQWGIRKNDVLNWWHDQDFDLNLPEHRGNCVTCWKKTDRKLMTIAAEDPLAFKFFDRMEQTYPDAGPGDFDRPRHFFRRNQSTRDIVERSRIPFVKWRSQPVQIEMFDPEMDTGGGCGDSCEIYADYEMSPQILVTSET